MSSGYATGRSWRRWPIRLVEPGRWRSSALVASRMTGRRTCCDSRKRVSPHSFRVTAITSLLEQGVPMEDVQYLAGHAEPRTTTLYDPRKKKVTRNIVERIPI